MALVPIISQTWDTTSVFTPTRMNNIEQNLAIVSKATGVEYSSGVSVKDMIDLNSNKAIVSSRSEVTINSYSVNKVGHLVTFSCVFATSSTISDHSALFKLPFKIVGSCVALSYSNSNATITLYGSNNTDTLTRDLGTMPPGTYSVGGTYATND